MKSSFITPAVCIAGLLLSSCLPAQPGATASVPTLAASPPTVVVSATIVPSATPVPTPTPKPLVPEFEHIVMIVFENKEFGTVVRNPQMPYFNALAVQYTLLTQFYAVTHPSLPNYLAMVSGNTFDLTFDCYSCSYDAPSFPDLIEASGRTWKTYQEDMPSACFEGTEAGQYAIKHNPFMYFKPIRLNAERCARSIVPFPQLLADMAAGQIPNYVFITPNLCNDAHDCDLDVADNWLKVALPPLQAALDAEAKPYLIVLTWDEGQGNHSCCGLPQEAGGRIATILISPQVKSGFEDATPYTLYSLLKTEAESWHLQYLGHAADPENVLITAPWK